MSKFITLVFAVSSLFYVFLLYSFRTSDASNSVNQRYRSLFLRSEIARKLLFLDRPGDGRFEYFSPEREMVLVEIDYQRRLPNENIKGWVEDMIRQTLRKEAVIQNPEREEIPGVDGFTDQDLLALEKETRDFFPQRAQSYLHILYVSGSHDAPSNTGLTLSDNAIFIFQGRIGELSGQRQTWALIERSTIMHEFGHLLGLEHVDRDDCVMSERVEVYEKRKYQFESIPTEFCEESMDLLRSIRTDVFF